MQQKSEVQTILKDGGGPLPGQMFIGCLALAIAEMLDSIPIFARRISFRHGLGWAILRSCGSCCILQQNGAVAVDTGWDAASAELKCLVGNNGNIKAGWLKQMTVYLKCDRNAEVQAQDVFLKDEVRCRDKVLSAKLNAIKVCHFPKEGENAA